MPMPPTGRQGGNMAHWTSTLETLRAGERPSTSAGIMAPTYHNASQVNSQWTTRRESPSHRLAAKSQHTDDAHGNESEDDLEMDLAKAALMTGTTAFEGREWEEADSLLQEALQVIQQLPPNQRAFCDLFALEHQLAICSYHTKELADAEYALLSLVQRPASSSEHRQYLCDAAHHLALLYVRMGRIDDAKAECEKALQGRRRLLGKNSEPALQSTALIAHIYSLASNHARAKACLAMIPEARRGDVVSAVEKSLEMKSSEQSDRSSVSTYAVSDGASQPWPQSTPSDYYQYQVDPAPEMNNRCHGPVSLDISASPLASPRPSYQRDDSRGSGLESLKSLRITSPSTAGSSRERRSISSSVTGDSAYKYQSPDLTAAEFTPVTTPLESWEPSKPKAPSGNTGLSRMEILRNLRCVPSDRFEEAVCNADTTALTSLLSKKRGGSWRSKMQKALHSRRVTALHFAALFGELEMARALLSAGYDINEVPELSATRQTPLKFAVGARQVDMVIFLTARGARPIEPDSWATMAGLLMDKSWLSNTLSTADREDLQEVPSRIIAILKSWLKKGWDPNAPYNASGRTLLHQAVAFESGFYKWDASLRGAMVRFLCNEGADPMRLDNKGNSPYDMATVVEDQDVLLVFDKRLKMKDLGQKLDGLAELKNNSSQDLVELSAEAPRHIELPG